MKDLKALRGDEEYVKSTQERRFLLFNCCQGKAVSLTDARADPLDAKGFNASCNRRYLYLDKSSRSFKD